MNKKTAPKNQELIFGIHPIIETLKAKKRPILTIYTTKPTPKAWSEIQPLLTKKEQLQYVERDVLTRIAGSTDHQGVVAVTTALPIKKTFFDPAKAPFLLMLDGIQDPRNLGAILRSAYCTNVSGVILIKKGSTSFNAVVYKSAAGLAEHLEYYEAATAHAAIDELKKAGYTIYLAAFGGNNATTTEFKQPLCLVIGSEGKGITPAILKSGTVITLPQKTEHISYNASVAAGILLCAIATQHKYI